MAHPLSNFRKKNSVSVKSFSRTVGVSRQSISRIEKGEQSPSLGLAYKIEQATGGEVTTSMLAAAASHKDGANA